MMAERTNMFERRDLDPQDKPVGFTLIELLVVISIIALLMAVLLPALSRARKQAKAMVCQARLRQWGMALAMYAQDNEGRFPCSFGGGAGAWLLRGALLSLTNEDPNVPQDSFHHFSTRDIACCPMATRSWPLGRTQLSGPAALPATFEFAPWTTNGTVGPTFPAWVMTRPAPPLVGSYGVNMQLFRIGGFGHPIVVRGHPLGPDISSLKGKASIPVVLDSAAPSGGPSDARAAPPVVVDAPFVGSNYPFCVNRHDGYVNGLFLDWSIRKIGLKELWKLKWSQDFDANGPWTKAGGVTPERWPKWMRKFKDY